MVFRANGAQCNIEICGAQGGSAAEHRSDFMRARFAEAEILSEKVSPT